MKMFLFLCLLISSVAVADTPPPNTVKAKTYSGDGGTAIDATGSALDVYLTNGNTPAALTIYQNAITVGTSAVRLTHNGSAPASTRVLLVAQLLGSSTANCFFGSSTVSNSGANRGVQMYAAQVFSFNNDAGDYYAICDTSTQTVLITEQE